METFFLIGMFCGVGFLCLIYALGAGWYWLVSRFLPAVGNAVIVIWSFLLILGLVIVIGIPVYCGITGADVESVVRSIFLADTPK